MRHLAAAKADVQMPFGRLRSARDGDQDAARGPQATVGEHAYGLCAGEPTVAQRRQQLGADATVVLSSHALLGEEHRHRRRQVLELDDVGRRRTKTVRHQHRRILVRYLDYQRAVVVSQEVQHPGHRSPTGRDLVGKGPP